LPGWRSGGSPLSSNWPITAFGEFAAAGDLELALDEVERGGRGGLTVKQLDWLDVLLLQPLDTVRAYELALKFDDFYELTDAGEAEEYLRRWVTEARGSEPEPLVGVRGHVGGSLERGAALAQYGSVQRVTGRAELPHPGSEAWSPRLPIGPQLQLARADRVLTRTVERSGGDHPRSPARRAAQRSRVW